MYIKIKRKCANCKSKESGRKKYCLACDIGDRGKLSGIDYLREEIRIRDGHVCQKCHKKWRKGERRFDVHHLDEKQESIKDYSWDKKNKDRMITLCHKCHLQLPHLVKKFKKNSQKNRPLLAMKETYNETRRLIWDLWKGEKVLTFQEAGNLMGISGARISQIIRRGEKMGWDT